VVTGNTRRTIVRLVGGWAVVLVALAALSISRPAGAAGPAGGTTMLGTASAQGIRLTYSVPDFLVVSEVVDGGGPVAQSALETGVGSSSFASLPYPGENGIGGPPLILGLVGQSPPAAYPFYVRADSSVNPTAELQDPSGSYSLRAGANAHEAVSTADLAVAPLRGSQPAPSLSTHTRVVSTVDGQVTVIAETLCRGLSLADGVLRIGAVRSRSVTTYEPGDPQPKTTTHLAVEGARVGDQAVRIGPDGVQVLGPTAPLPDGKSMNETLEQAGLAVRTVSTGDVAGGGAADALEVTSAHGAPVPGLPRGILKIRIGGATTALIAGTPGGSPPVTEPGASPLGDAGGRPVPAPSEPAGQAALDPADGAGAGAVHRGAVPAPWPASRTEAGEQGSAVPGRAPEDPSGFPSSTTTEEAAPASRTTVHGPGQPTGAVAPLAPKARVLYLLIALAGAATVVLSGAWGTSRSLR
jgi:hypothetical protein